MNLADDSYAKSQSLAACKLNNDSMLMVSTDIEGKQTTMTFSSEYLTDTLIGIENFLREAGFVLKGRLAVLPTTD